MASPYYNPNYRQPTNPYLVGQNNMSLGVAPTTQDPIATSGRGTSTGLFSMFSNPNFIYSPNNPNLGSNIGNTGQLLGGVGSLYGAIQSGKYFDDVSGMLDQQMGLYQSELDRRNKTRQGYSTAFSDAQGA